MMYHNLPCLYRRLQLYPRLLITFGLELFCYTFTQGSMKVDWFSTGFMTFCWVAQLLRLDFGTLVSTYSGKCIFDIIENQEVQFKMWFFFHCRIITTIEWLCLVGLTVLHSHLPIPLIHEIFTGLWLCTNLLNMLICSYLELNLFRSRPYIKLRRWFVIISFMVEFFTLYFYYRHNIYCEPYMYSYFCVCEYAVIIFNMLYHVGTPTMIEFPLNGIKNCLRPKTPIPSKYKDDINEEMTQRLIDNS